MSDGAYWQLVTNAFTHVEVWHIGFNMLALWVLGPQLELAIGRTRFLALYFLSALAGSTLVYWLGGTTTATLGASAAVFGLMGALLVLALKVGGNVQQILMWIGINFLITVVWRGTISWQGHLGGFLGGAADRRGAGLRAARPPHALAGGRPVRRSVSGWSWPSRCAPPRSPERHTGVSTPVDSHVENYIGVINTSVHSLCTEPTSPGDAVPGLVDTVLTAVGTRRYMAGRRDSAELATPSGWRR